MTLVATSSRSARPTAPSLRHAACAAPAAMMHVLDPAARAAAACCCCATCACWAAIVAAAAGVARGCGGKGQGCRDLGLGCYASNEGVFQQPRGIGPVACHPGAHRTTQTQRHGTRRDTRHTSRGTVVLVEQLGKAGANVLQTTGSTAQPTAKPVVAGAVMQATWPHFHPATFTYDRAGQAHRSSAQHRVLTELSQQTTTAHTPLPCPVPLSPSAGLSCNIHTSPYAPTSP